ncbi:MAG: GntR family transcriptional regulator [Candidatus Dormibacteraceae bacterium]
MTDGSQAASIEQRLRRAIQDLDLAPGEKLTERRLEKTFEASRTPVRAALLRLQAEGLVQRDGRGWIVSPIDLEDIRALEEFREALETAAVRIACERASDGDLRRLDDLFRAITTDPSREEGHRLGTDFHVELARLSGNHFLVEAIAGAMTRLERPRWLEVRTGEGRSRAWEEHRRVLEAIARRDGATAQTLIVDHLRGTRDRLLTSLEAERRRFRASGLAIVDTPVPATERPFLEKQVSNPRA